MTVQQVATIQKWQGLSGDTKPTSAPMGSMFYETNTGKEFVWNGAWVQYAATMYTANLLPITDNTYDIGSVALSYKDLHVQNLIYATSVAGNWNPSADNTYDLGENSTPLEWKDLYVDGIAYVDDMSVPNGFSMVSEVTAYSHFDHDNGAWDFFTKTSGAAQLSRLRIPNGTDSVDIALANANLLFGHNFGIRANAANGTVVDFEAYENGAYVIVANMNSSASAANWTFSRNVAFTQAATLSTSTGILTIDGDDGIILQTTGSGLIQAKEIISVGTGEGGTIAATGLTLRAPSITTGGAGNVQGADLVITAGAGTGTGDVGTIVFKTYQVAAAGDNLQTTLETILTLDEDYANFAKTAHIGLSVPNTKMTLGLTIDQAAADDEILALKSSDVSHGCTDTTETDTYLAVAKVLAGGGATLDGFMSAGAGAAIGFRFSGNSLTAANTTKSTAGRSLVELTGREISGTVFANVTADGNVFGIRARVAAADATVALFDEDGDLWLNGSLTLGGGTPVATGVICGGRYIEVTEMGAPGAGAANTVRIYAFEGAGDALTDLCAVFQDGSIDVFAQEVTEPDSPIFQYPDATELVMTMRKPDRKTIQFVATFPDGRDFVMREIRYPVERW